MAWRGWNKNKKPYHNGVLDDEEAFDIICRKFNEYLTCQDYNFTALTYYLKMLFENGTIYMSANVKKQNSFRKGNPIDYKNRGNRKNRWEHVVPTKVLIEYALWLYQKHGIGTSSANVQAFADDIKNLRENYGNICIVTKEEDCALPKQTMRSGNRIPDSNVCDLSKCNPWDRYIGIIAEVYEVDKSGDSFKKQISIPEN